MSNPIYRIIYTPTEAQLNEWADKGYRVISVFMAHEKTCAYLELSDAAHGTQQERAKSERIAELEMVNKALSIRVDVLTSQLEKSPPQSSSMRVGDPAAIGRRIKVFKRGEEIVSGRIVSVVRNDAGILCWTVYGDVAGYHVINPGYAWRYDDVDDAPTPASETEAQHVVTNSDVGRRIAIGTADHFRIAEIVNGKLWNVCDLDNDAYHYVDPNDRTCVWRFSESAASDVHPRADDVGRRITWMNRRTGNWEKGTILRCIKKSSTSHADMWDVKCDGSVDRVKCVIPSSDAWRFIDAPTAEPTLLSAEPNADEFALKLDNADEIPF